MEFKSIVEPLYLKDNLSLYIKGMDGTHYPHLISKNTNNEEWCCKIPRFAGSGTYGETKEDFYTIIPKKYNIEKFIAKFKYAKNIDKFDYYICLLNYNCCINFLNYCKTYFCRACLYFNKINIENVGGNGLKTVPIFDFSDPIFNNLPEYIDNALFKKYNIKQEIIDHILDILPNYYNLDLTKYKKVEN